MSAKPPGDAPHASRDTSRAPGEAIGREATPAPIAAGAPRESRSTIDRGASAANTSPENVDVTTRVTASPLREANAPRDGDEASAHSPESASPTAAASPGTDAPLAPEATPVPRAAGLLPQTRATIARDGTPAPAVAAASLAADAAQAAKAAVTEAAIAADAAEDISDVPDALPFRPRTRTLVAMLVVLVVLYTCYLASELIVPIVLAVFLGLCGNPIVARLQRGYVPRWIGALLVVIGGLWSAGYAASVLLPPAADWVRAAPSELRHHIPRLRELAKPFEEAGKATESFERLAELGPPARAPAQVEVVEKQNTMIAVLSEAPRFVGSVLAVMILSYFFMVYGEDLLRKFVTVVPGWRTKRLTVDILRSIQIDISRYIFTITLINLVVAVVCAAALYWLGLDPVDALLWGVVAGVMNFAPYIGPLMAAIAFLLVGLVAFDSLPQAMAVPGVFLLIHLIEGQLVTPVILGKRLAISPVIVMLWLFLWGWMWGIAGLLLAVPMLVCFKIYCSRVESMKAWAAMMEP